MHKDRLRAIFQNVLSLTIIFGLCFYIWSNRDQFFSSFSLSPIQFFLLSFFMVMSWFANSFQTLILMRLVNKQIGVWENFFVMMGATLGNYLPMRLGTIMRMRYFKHAFGVDYSAFSGIIGARTFLLLLCSGLVASIGLTGLIYMHHKVPVVLLIFFGGVFIFSAVVLLIPFPRFEENTSLFAGIYRQLTLPHSLLRNNPRVFLLMMLCICCQFAMLGLRFLIAFKLFGISTHFWIFFIIGPIATLSTFIHLTPGNLGIREWLIGLIASVTGMDFQGAVFAGTLDRSIMLILTFLLGGAGLFYTMIRTRRIVNLTD